MALGGTRAVGHPVDVATGAVTTDATDVALAAPSYLRLARRYSTQARPRPQALFGHGWSCEYDVTLSRDLDGFVFTTESGDAITFDEADRQPGEVLHIENPGVFHELRADGAWWIVRSWSSGEFVRYWFRAGSGIDEFVLEHIEDEPGQFRTLRRDGGRPSSVVEVSTGRELFLHYGPLGLVDSVVLARGDERRTVAEYWYSAEGLLETVRDAREATLHYEYDHADRLVVEHRRDGGRFEFEYDSAGRCIHTTGQDGYDRQRLTYFPLEHRTTVEDSRGGVWSYFWRADSQVDRLVTPLESTEVTTYDELGRVIAQSDAENHRTTYHFDAHGNQSRIDHPDGAYEAFTYDALRRPLTTQDRSGAIWRREFDDDGRLTTQIDPLGNRWTFTYDDRSRLTAITGPLGTRTSFAYDRFGDLSEVSAPSGGRVSFGRDIFGNIVHQVDAAGLVTRVDRDAGGRPMRLELPDGSVHAYTFSPSGELLELATPRGRTVYRFAPCRRLLGVQTPDEPPIELTWGTAPGDLLQVRNEAGDVYAYEYDVEGRLIREVDFRGFGWRYRYDRAGRLTNIAGDDGQATEVEYDAVGRLVRQSAATGEERLFAYDGEGRTISARAGDVEVRFERDALGRVVREWQGDFPVTFAYDADGRQVGLGAGDTLAVDYGRDTGGRVNRVTVSHPQTQAVHWIARAEHDRASRPVSYAIPGGITQRWRYLASGLPEARETVGGTGVLDEVRYQWTRADEIAALTDSVSGLVQYEHDARGYAVLERRGGATRHRSVDSVGNVYASPDRSDRTYGPGGALERAEGRSYRYRASGERAEKQTARDRWEYEWNGWGELAAVVRPDEVRVEFRYDALGRRVEKRIGETRTMYRWNGEDLLAEATAERIVWWVVHPISHAPLARGSGDTWHGVLCDHMFTPTELYDREGRIVWRMRLDLYGVESLDGDATLCAWRWPGQYADSETGLYYNRFRYYDPEEGLYLSPDPIGLAGGPRPFAYVENPTVASDPFGLARDIITVWHYTSADGFKGIQSGGSKGVWSFLASSPAVGHPHGVYFTSKFSPDMTSEHHRMGIPNDKRTHFFAVQVDASHFSTIFTPLPGGRGSTGVSIYIPTDQEVRKILQNEWEKKQNRDVHIMRQGQCGIVPG
jgi:RHS repeat-associated protein